MSSQYPTAVVVLGSWTEQAACGSHENPDWWFAADTKSVREAGRAKAVCARCPVRAACLDDAVRRGDPDSIAGGMTPSERRAWVASRAPQDGEESEEGEDEPADAEQVDEVAVKKYLRGDLAEADLSDRERLAAVEKWMASGRTQIDLDELHGLRKGSTSSFVSRMRARARRDGWEFPELVTPNRAREFSDAEVLDIRERSHGGATDQALAMSFDVARQTIAAIVTGHRYTHVGGPLRTRRSKKSLAASREHMTGHSGSSQRAVLMKQQMRKAA